MAVKRCYEVARQGFAWFKGEPEPEKTAPWEFIGVVWAESGHRASEIVRDHLLKAPGGLVNIAPYYLQNFLKQASPDRPISVRVAFAARPYKKGRALAALEDESGGD